MAALTRSGARNASEIVMLILRVVQLSRLAMLSVVAAGSAISSSSQRRPRAIAGLGGGLVSRRAAARGCCRAFRCDRPPGAQDRGRSFSIWHHHIGLRARPGRPAFPATLAPRLMPGLFPE
jgi:hypothetical protein